jgi:cytochrome b involved in lipid metabolism
MDDGPAHAERALRSIERHNARVGHENIGFLSGARGFVPLMAPRLRMSDGFTAWDELAAELPALHENLTLRSRIERLPLLDASSASLPASELLRAGALLAMLTHAYWYVETEPPAGVPDSLRHPWRQVRARLGRKQEVLSYIDLIIYNWRLRDASGPLALHNLDLLLPTVGNQEERVFYLTQLEILVRAAPTLQLMASAQTAAARCDEPALEQALERIAVCLVDCTNALTHIDPMPFAATHVDPVRWAKTVAPFAVPIRNGDIGPSGTSSPLFNTLDVFFGRSRFESPLGREIMQLRATYPRAWRMFLAALQKLPVQAFVARSRNSSLQAAFAHALDCYAGPGGFLGRHRRKVYGYLEIAFKVGRTLTIGGFSGPFAARTWNEVDDALTTARAERSSESHPCSSLRQRAAGAHDSHRTQQPSYATHRWSEIVEHSTKERGYWLVVHNNVYDITRFLDRHPGGPAILRAYAGIAATQSFDRAHCPSRLLERARKALLIGFLHDPTPQLSAAGARTYHTLVAALQLIVEMQNALELDMSFTMHASAGALNAYEQQRERERAVRIKHQYVALLVGRVLPGVHAALVTLHPGLPQAPASSENDTLSSAHETRCLLRELKRGLITTLIPFEDSDPLSATKQIECGWLQCLTTLKHLAH